MNVRELSEKTGFTVVDTGADLSAVVNGAYACDLLSWVIGRAGDGYALVTVMTNVNVIAVAVMADISCVVLTEGVELDGPALQKACEHKVAVISSSMPTYETCVAIEKALKQS